MPVLLLLCASSVSALGLGDLHGQPSLGDRPLFEVELLSADRVPIDAACFRLVQPTGGDDLPWLKQATLTVRRGTSQVLEIRSHIPLREPIIQLAVKVGCGQEISRQYVVFASPARDGVPGEQRVEADLPARLPLADEAVVPGRLKPVRPSVSRARAAIPVRHKAIAAPLPDRLQLSDSGDVVESSLRLATELSPQKGLAEEARDILRLEYRMLLALNEQATTQLETAGKLRDMESTLNELQQRASDVAERVERQGERSAAPTPRELPAPTATPGKGRDASAAQESSVLSEWTIYGLLLGAVVGLAGWLGWRNFHQRGRAAADEDIVFPVHENREVPATNEPTGSAPEIDFHVGDIAHGVVGAATVDLELGAEDRVLSEHAPVVPDASAPHSIAATTVDEHFEANPVMELAEIMLSFGRVKGAAQALQEFIDNNPQEALQPWIKLIEVYRMAGMRSEFEAVAKNLNQNFNVEVQRWGEEDGRLELVDMDEKLSPRPRALEDMPRILNTVCDLWPSGDVVGYLYQLLRDNRGGTRIGFALSFVEEILFLIELKETANRFGEKEERL